MSKPPGTTHEEIDAIFQYHAPVGDQPHRYERIRGGARNFAHMLLDTVPPGPDQSVAIRKLRECVMTANAAVALAGDGAMPDLVETDAKPIDDSINVIALSLMDEIGKIPVGLRRAPHKTLYHAAECWLDSYFAAQARVSAS